MVDLNCTPTPTVDTDNALVVVVYIGAVTSLPLVSNLLVTLADPISAMVRCAKAWDIHAEM